MRGKTEFPNNVDVFSFDESLGYLQVSDNQLRIIQYNKLQGKLDTKRSHTDLLKRKVQDM